MEISKIIQIVFTLLVSIVLISQLKKDIERDEKELEELMQLTSKTDTNGSTKRK